MRILEAELFVLVALLRLDLCWVIFRVCLLLTVCLRQLSAVTECCEVR